MLNQRSTLVLARRRRLGTALIAISGVLFALWATLNSPVPAIAAEGDPYTIVVNVKAESIAVADVSITVDGPGGPQVAATNADGQVRFHVPEKNASYTVTLDESTLPEGIAVIDESGENPAPNVRIAEVKNSPIVSQNFYIGRGERHTTSWLDQFIERIVNGLNFGLMLALAAIGLSLIYGTTGISNFAHGEMVTFGGLMALLFSTGLGWPLWFGLPVAILLSAAFGLTMDAGLWRPLRRKGLGVVQLMIISIGLSLALRYTYQIFVGGDPRRPPQVDSLPQQNLIGSVGVTDIASMGISIIVILIFAWWLMRTRIGRATRAVSDNPSLAAASGIDVDLVVRVVWVVGAGLAGLAGVLWAYFIPGIKWDMGSGILLLMFAAVTLGGLGTAFGALIGSLIVGLIVEVSTLWIPSDLKYVGALVVLILILLFRPQGILGRRERVG